MIKRDGGKGVDGVRDRYFSFMVRNFFLKRVRNMFMERASSEHVPKAIIEHTDVIINRKRVLKHSSRSEGLIKSKNKNKRRGWGRSTTPSSSSLSRLT